MPVSDARVIADRLDLEMLERPHLWPCIRKGFPMLFLKRTIDGNLQTAMCIQGDGGYLVCAYIFPVDRDKPVDREIIKYPTAEAVRADGWIVD
jgi:hypothetical protein